MKQYDIEFYMINDEVLTQVIEVESRYAALEAIYQSFRHSTDGFVQFEE